MMMTEFNCPVHGPERRDQCFVLLDELIAAGWSSVPQGQIPDNWRDLVPPPQHVPYSRIPFSAQLELALA